MKGRRRDYATTHISLNIKVFSISQDNKLYPRSLCNGMALRKKGNQELPYRKIIMFGSCQWARLDLTPLESFLYSKYGN